MPRRKFIDKKSATTFTLLHRAQDDPLIHNDQAPDMVFAEKQAKVRRPTDDDYAYSSSASIFSGNSDYRSTKTKQRGDLEEEFGLAFRKNEGEAAQHGVFFDDTEYDYMQHMRDLGSGEGAVTWVEASAPPQRPKRKQKLEDALRSIDLDSESGRFEDAQSVGTQSSAARSLLPEEVLPSEFVRKRTYQDQQDVPDAIAGLQPDMDPELREALRALDDEEYVDDQDDDDVFGQLVEDGYEIDKDDFERIGEQGMFDDEQGWESDDTIKAGDQSPPPQLVPAPPPDLSELESTAPPANPQEQPPADPTSGAWLDEYKKFKSAAKSSRPKPTGTQSSQTNGLRDASTILSTASTRKSEHQQLLDARFDRLIEKEYPENGQFDDALSNASGLTGMSKVSGLSKASGVSKASNMSGYSISSSASQSMRSDFDGIIDEFLGSSSRVGKRGKRVVKFGPQTGMEQLDEVRNGLGPARLGARGKTSARAKG